MSKIVIDTNVLLDNPEVLERYEDIIIPFVVLEELDKLKRNKDNAFAARKAIRALKKHGSKITIVGLEGDVLDINDNRIIQVAALDKDSKLLTNDITMQIKAEHFEVELEDLNDEESDTVYTGYKDVEFDDCEAASFYQNPVNKYDCLENQYLLIRHKETRAIVDKYKWSKGTFKPVKGNPINNKYAGKIKPRNLEQELYLDLLEDDNITIKVAYGDYGTGKDYLALLSLLGKIDSGRFDRILWVRNNVEATGTKKVGALPGDLNEKLKPYAELIGDILGDETAFETLLQLGKIKLVHPGFLRGRSYKNSIIYCTEAQNLTTELTKLIISRIGEGSIALLNGDYEQADEDIFRQDNGLKNMINKLKGMPKFGCVKLLKGERSEAANYARLL